jgi:UDP-glucuronate 4-epimerase
MPELPAAATDAATPVLVTGAAGFIGFHVAKRLLDRGQSVIGVDNLNSYYDPQLKEARLAQLRGNSRFSFVKADISDVGSLPRIFAEHQIEQVVHLAAQAGVRYSLDHPHEYIQSNIVGFLNVLEACRSARVKHLVFASSSSVYGGNTRIPFSVHDNVDHPVSLYAATKKSNELMAHSYAHLFGIPCTGLRFFTAYGPWGRPDMAIFLFTKAILEARPIDVFNNGEMKRDFTYVDDIAQAVVQVLDRPPSGDLSWSSDTPDPGSSFAPYRVYNIGNHETVPLTRLIEILERTLGTTANKRFLPLQPGDVLTTYADVTDLERDIGFHPATPLDVGIARFVEWYRTHYAV